MSIGTGNFIRDPFVDHYNDALRNAMSVAQPQRVLITTQYLHEPGSAMHIPLGSLHLLWLQRFGDMWVTEDRLCGDTFWSAASERLFNATLAERAYVQAPNRTSMHAYRIRGTDADR